MLAMAAIVMLAGEPPRGSPLAGVTYIEASTGLNDQTWDGGRTEPELADVNGDGHPDIVTVGDHGSPGFGGTMKGITVWFGDGAGTWFSFQTGKFGYGGVAVGDVNNDGKVDVGYGIHHNYSGVDFGDQVMEVVLGDGTGKNWTPWDDGLGLNGQEYGMFGADFADIDGDGWLDIASDSFGCCDGVHVSRNNHDGTWMQTFGFVNGNSTDDLVFGDVNNDGAPDFAVAHQFGTVYINNGAGSFTLSDGGLPAGGNVGRRGPSLGDVDGDGRDDLSFVNSSGGVEVWLRTAGGVWMKASAGLPASGNTATRMADMDGDGLMDVCAFGAGTMTVWGGNGGAGWTKIGEFFVGSPGTYAGMAVADGDHNGRPDIAIVCAQPPNGKNKLRFYRESTAAVVPGIRVTRPPVHRVVRAGSAVFIDWCAAVPGGSGTVDLELSLSGAGGPWVALANGVPSSGRHQLALNAAWDSEDAFIRATIKTGAGNAIDVHGPFTILGEGCFADCDGSGALDIDDFICFQTLFGLGDLGADCDGSGGLDADDFVCFQTAFGVGCG